MMRATIGTAAMLWFGACCASLAGQEASTSPALPAIETADYDTDGRFRVNGKPFFPILLYDAPTDPNADAMALAELREFGFNTLTCKAEAAGALRELGFYGAVHHAKAGVDASGIFLVLGSDSPALYFKKDLLKQTAEANAKSRAAVPNRPLANAIGYWEDEPTGVVSGKLPAQAVYEDLVAAIDVSAPYLYPVPYQPVASVGDAVRRARAATGGKKPLVPILQLFAWDAKARYPTVAELRCMTYLALVEGATGIGYYSYSHVTGKPKTTIAAVEPELWKSVKQLNREVAELTPKLAGTLPLRLPNPSPVLITIVPGQTDVLAVIVNPSTEPQEARLSTPNRSGPPIATEGVNVVVDDGTFSVQLKPLEVVVLRRAKAK